MLVSHVAASEFSAVDTPLETDIETAYMEIETLSEDEFAQLQLKLQDEAYEAITDDQRQEVSALIESLDTAGLLTSRNARTDNISINDQQLILNANDGVGTVAQARMMVLASQQRSDAADRYGSTMIGDCYRHYSWNFRGTKDPVVGLSATKIIANNHEWVESIYTPVNKQYNNLITYYSNKGSSDVH